MDTLRLRLKSRMEKSTDKTEETLLVIIKKMQNLNEEMNSRDRLYMKKLTALERAQKSSYIPKGKHLPRNKNEEDKPSSFKVPNTLTPKDIVEKDSSYEDEQSDEYESDDEEINEHANIVDFKPLTFFFGVHILTPPLVSLISKKKKKIESSTLMIM